MTTTQRSAAPEAHRDEGGSLRRGGVSLPCEVKSDYRRFIKWCDDHGIKEIGHLVAPLVSSKLRTKPCSRLDFDEGKFHHGSELDGSSFPTGGGRVVHKSKVTAVPDVNSRWFVLPDPARAATVYIFSEMVDPDGHAMCARKPLRDAGELLGEELAKASHVLGLRAPKKGEEFALAVGFEKEFFIVPEHVTSFRPDLRYLGQTVVGRPGPINQNLQGVYLTIPRAKEETLLQDIADSLGQLGIVVVQKHLEVGQTGNELAGRQCEIVLRYSPALEAADNELLARQVAEDVCARHGFKALIGSKSFTESSRGEGINGSGKHTNLSLVRFDRETGEAVENLLHLEEFRDGPDAAVNLFGLMLVAAMGRHWEVFDSALASRGNDLRRVPGFEAPVYLSAFLGSTAEFRDSLRQDRNRSVSLGLSGDKLEWRTPGANTPMHYPLAFLHMAVVEVLREVTRRVESGLKEGKRRRDLVAAEARRLREEIDYFVVDEDVFEITPGEARARFGKRIVHDTPEALEALESLEGIKFLIHDDVFTREMVDAFRAVQLESYVERVIAEAQILASMAKVLSNRVFRSPLMQLDMAHLEKIEPCLRQRQQFLGRLNGELLKKIDAFCIGGASCDEGCGDLTGTIKAIRAADSLDEQASMVVKRILPLMREIRRLYEDVEELLGGAEEVSRL